MSGARAPKKFEAHHEMTQVGQDHPRDMRTDGPAEDSLDPPLIEPVYGPNWKDKAEILAFMEEKIEIVVNPTAEKGASPIVEVWNGGRPQRFIRGRPQVCKRKFVDALARAKEVSYTQEQYKDANGADAIRNIPTTTLRYTFQVIEDQSPKGRDWLKQLLAEA